MVKTLLSLSLCLAFTVSVRADDPSKDGIAAFKQYLEKNFKDRKWQTGPAQLESRELQKAYPDQRFFYVYSAPPLPPGAFLPELVERHRKASEEFRKNYISLAVAIGKDGIRPLANNKESLGKGLIALNSEEDAKVAAAAVLSLYIESGYTQAPKALPASSVKVTKSDKGWTCQVQQPMLQGNVTFDAEGKLATLSKSSHIPLPPGARPRGLAPRP